jgi:hypothetical protein
MQATLITVAREPLVQGLREYISPWWVYAGAKRVRGMLPVAQSVVDKS